MKADLIIRNGRILDGTGAPERRGDIAVASGRIHAVSDRLERLEADEVIDAAGLIVAPGFVDIHSHGDLVLAWPSEDRLSLLEGRLAQGITTEVVGNCGLGATPLFGYGKELLPHINGWMSPATFDWHWSDLNSYFSHLESVGIPANVGALVPHGPLRLGAAHLASGETDEAARRQMTDALDAALDDGALGLSAGLIYPPGMYTSTSELTVLARRLSRRGGVFTAHVRGSSETLLDAVGELIQIGRDAEVPIHHSHTEAVGRAHWSALLHGPEQIADLPVPVAESPGAVRIGHPERSHLVEYLAPNSVFNSLPRQRSSPHLRPDDRLVTIDRVLHHASLGVA